MTKTALREPSITIIGLDGTTRQVPFQPNMSLHDCLNPLEDQAMLNGEIVAEGYGQLPLSRTASLPAGVNISLRNRHPFLDAVYDGQPICVFSYFADSEKAQAISSQYCQRGINGISDLGTGRRNVPARVLLSSAFGKLVAVVTEGSLVEGTDLIPFLDKNFPNIPVLCELPNLQTTHPRTDSPRKLTYYYGDLSRDTHYLIDFAYWALAETSGLLKKK